MNKYQYSSVQVMVPNLLSKKIISWGHKHIKNEDVSEREDKIHITILYGLHTQHPEEIQELLSKKIPFEIKLGKISIFKNDDFDVVKIEAFGPGLFSMNRLLKTNLRNTPTHTYQPHVTIAYIKKNKCKNLMGDETFKDEKWTTNSVVFSSKNGLQTKIKLHYDI